MTPHVLVIGGGQNAEHDVSLETAAAIEGALRSRGFEASTITIGRDGRWRQGEEPLGESAAGSLVAALPLQRHLAADGASLCRDRREPP